MFNLYFSNDAARLADRLGETLEDAGAHPLVPRVVLVPQAGLKRWLQVYLAEQRGVLANVEFTAPAEFAWRLLRAWKPGLPRRSPFEPALLRWRLLRMLGELGDDARLAAPRAYLHDDPDGLKRFGLARELANVFERYQAYRRDTLLAWEAGRDQGEWQAELWRQIVAQVPTPDRARLISEWLEAFDNTGRSPPGMPVRMSAFACSNVSPDVLRMLGVASQHAEIDFHFVTPCREYWGDVGRFESLRRATAAQDETDNPLLSAFGKVGADFVEQLFSYQQIMPGEERNLCDPALDRSTLLGRVRDDILARRAPGVADARADDSIQCHACHSPQREVEVLHDQLLAMLQADDSLNPRDIAVMMPDVASYRPYINAVFGGLDGQASFIPYSVSDLPASAAHPVTALFERLLDVPASRWQAGELIDMLAVPGVMRRLGLEHAGVETLRRWTREAGIRWGRDAQARADAGGFAEFSWDFGLKRMLLGAMTGDAPPQVAGVAPYAQIEGSGLLRLDALLQMVAAWDRLVQWSHQPATGTVWQQRLLSLMERLYRPAFDDRNEARALELIRDALATLAQDSAAASDGSDESLAWPQVRAFLSERLGEADARQRFLQGGVTFCGMVPLRVVPFRVICVLGMDENAFPRRDPASSLNPLMQGENLRLGDRSVREDDRFLWLQLISAARETLYLSYVGRDPVRNEPQPPATVVADLLEHVERDYLGLAPDAPSPLRTVHPLHPFDPRLFDAECSRVFTFRDEWRPAATPTRRKRPSPFLGRLPAAPERELDVHEAIDFTALTRYLRKPGEVFLRERLGVHMARTPEAEEEREPLEANKLIRYRVVKRLLAPALGAAAEAAQGEPLCRQLLAEGELPPGELGELAFADAREWAAPLREVVLEMCAGRALSQPATSELDLGETRLIGQPSAHFEQRIVRARPGPVDGRHILALWLDALLLAAMQDATIQAMYVGANEKSDPIQTCITRLQPVTATTARKTLGKLCALYRKRLAKPRVLLPKLSWDYLQCAQNKDADTAWAMVRKDLAQAEAKLRGEDIHGARPETLDPALRLLWRGQDMDDPDGSFARIFRDTAKRVLGPIALATETGS